MEQYTIELRDSRKRRELLKLLKGLEYVGSIRLVKDPGKARLLREFAESMREIAASERGEVKLKDAKQMLRELRR